MNVNYNFITLYAVSIIASIITYIQAKKKLTQELEIAKTNNKHEIEKLMQQHKINIEDLKEKHRLEMEAKDKEYAHEKEMTELKGQWKPKSHLKSYQKLVRKLKQLTDRSWSISLDNRIKKINYVVRGWVNYFRIANMKNKITEIDEHLRVRIRVIIWKQWKKIRKKCESLQKLGIPFEIAFNCANTRKGYYQICKTRYVQFAINNERLRKRGLVFLLDQYGKVHI